MCNAIDNNTLSLRHNAARLLLCIMLYFSPFPSMSDTPASAECFTDYGGLTSDGASIDLPVEPRYSGGVIRVSTDDKITCGLGWIQSAGYNLRVTESALGTSLNPSYGFSIWYTGKGENFLFYGHSWTVFRVNLEIPSAAMKWPNGLQGGDTIATLKLHAKGEFYVLGLTGDIKSTFYVRLRSSRSIAPPNECDVINKNASVSLGNYPIDNSERDVGILVGCLNNRSATLSLSGKVDTPTIFSNVSPTTPASGVGIEILKDNKPIAVGDKIPVGVMSTSHKSLGLKARYALNGKPLAAGNVRAVINVELTFN
ncbi:fimbrial protein [Aeromonas salmonicida]|uniref:fimbrial protein n=1 Tax=Aeromonas salmonicida TaxID=645 RepID=UPI003D055279